MLSSTTHRWLEGKLSSQAVCPALPSIQMSWILSTGLEGQHCILPAYTQIPSGLQASAVVPRQVLYWLLPFPQAAPHTSCSHFGKSPSSSCGEPPSFDSQELLFWQLKGCFQFAVSGMTCCEQFGYFHRTYFQMQIIGCSCINL